MKTFGKLAFGFSAVNAGQRNVSYEPELVAGANAGSFRITPPVSKALLLQHGDNIMFVTNADNIDVAIRDKAPEVVEFCTANGLDIDSMEAAIAIHKEFDMWGIAKGIQEFDSKGNPKTTRERMTKADKAKYVDNHFEECLEAARASENEELVAALNREGATEEELKAVLIEAIQGDEVAKYKGSKCANPASTTGTGVSLTFTDSNVWNQLKADMGDTAEKLNRVFAIDVENLVDAEIFNGHENVAVKVAVLGESKEEKPIRVGKKADDSDDETAAE
jgi:hypothetical protein